MKGRSLMTKAIKIKKNLSIQENGFVFDPATGESYTLNPIALEMMRFLTEGQNKEEMKQYYLDNYDVDEWKFEKAYLDFIALLDKHHLISKE